MSSVESVREKRPHLVLEPDDADERETDANLVDEAGAGFGFGPAEGEIDDQSEDRSDVQAVALREVAEGEQPERELGELGAELIVELREARDHEGDEEDEQPDHHEDEEGRVDEGGAELFGEGKRDALEVEEALEDFFEVAGALAGEQRGGVDEREVALGFEGFGDGLAGLDARGDVFELGAEAEVLLALGEQLE